MIENAELKNKGTRSDTSQKTERKEEKGGYREPVHNAGVRAIRRVDTALRPQVWLNINKKY